MAGTISQRADKFAAKIRPPAPVDNRSPDQKMAEFMKTYDPNVAMKKARTAAARRNT